MRRTLPLLLIAIAVACSKKPKTPKAPVPAAAPPKAATPPAPPTVPKTLIDRIEREWPAIEAAGKAFETALAAATAARAADDREKMDDAIDEAKKQSAYASEHWAEIYYSADDIKPEAAAEASRKYMSAKEKIVKGWMEKSKALAQFSRAK